MYDCFEMLSLEGVPWVLTQATGGDGFARPPYAFGPGVFVQAPSSRRRAHCFLVDTASRRAIASIVMFDLGAWQRKRAAQDGIVHPSAIVSADLARWRAHLRLMLGASGQASRGASCACWFEVESGPSLILPGRVLSSF